MADEHWRYRCTTCGEIPEPPSRHKMASCKCGDLSVDRGWYGSRIVYKDRETVEVDMGDGWKPLPQPATQTR